MITPAGVNTLQRECIRAIVALRRVTADLQIPPVETLKVLPEFIQQTAGKRQVEASFAYVVLESGPSTSSKRPMLSQPSSIQVKLTASSPCRKLSDG